MILLIYGTLAPLMLLDKRAGMLSTSGTRAAGLGSLFWSIPRPHKTLPGTLISADVAAPSYDGVVAYVRASLLRPITFETERCVLQL